MQKSRKTPLSVFSLNRTILSPNPIVAVSAACTALVLGACAGPSGEPIDGAAAPPETASTSSAITDSDLSRHIALLASDEFEGRAPGTGGETLTIEYIASEFERIGLRPGVDGSYYQDVPLVEITLDDDASSFLVGRNGVDTPLATGGDVVFWTGHAVSDIRVENSEMVFVGYGSVAPEYGWNDYEGIDVRGKTVVMLVNDPGYATGDPDLFNGNAMTYYGRWTYKYEEAARQGAAAAIVIHDTAPASYGWDTVRNSWTGAQIHLDRADGNISRIEAEAWITHDVAERLFSEAGLDLAAMKEAAQRRGFRAVPMGGMTATISLHNSIRRMRSPNVIGVVEGSERPDEYVMYTAHWDHLGVSSDSALEDPIFNGAADNATGVAAIIEIAELMAATEPRPERSVLFAAVTAEESGLLGSAYLAENPPVPLSQVAGGINIDLLLPVGRSRNVVVIGYGASELEDYLRQAAAEQGRTTEPDPAPEAGYFYRSDHVSFAKHGVPMLYANGGEDLLQGGRAAGRAFANDYRDNRYHQTGDEYDSAWDMSGILEDTRLFHTVGYRLSRTEEWPNWHLDNEFRAIRDASRNGR